MDRNQSKNIALLLRTGRRLACGIICLLFTLSTGISDTGFPETDTASRTELDPFSSGILWQIENDHSPPSYLFGTIHIEDPRVTQLPTAVEQAYRGSRSLTTEVLLDTESILRVSARLVITGGDTLEKLIGVELFNAVGGALRSRGMTPDVAKFLKPWAAALFLSLPPSPTGEFLDRSLYLRAQENGKSVYGLETIDEQIEIFDSLPLEDQVTLLKENLAESDIGESLLDAMIEAYILRDLAELSRIAEGQFSRSPVQLRLKQKLLSDRNTRMAMRMDDRLQEGNAFIAVGALHLAGPTGLLNQLKTLGYRIRRIY